ncbi:MAG: DinB family protein [Candidatus Brocadiales bacterium]
MKWQQLIIDSFGRVDQVLEKAQEGLTLDDLNLQIRPDCNSIGWLTWHLTRAQDKAISDLMQEEQLWVKDKFYAKFNRPPDATDTGYGHHPEALAEFKSPDVQTLMEYHQAVLERTKRYVINLSETELGREIDHPRLPTVGARLMAVISDNLQHAGQVAYLRGLQKGKGWLVE